MWSARRLQRRANRYAAATTLNVPTQYMASMRRWRIGHPQSYLNFSEMIWRSGTPMLPKARSTPSIMGVGPHTK